MSPPADQTPNPPPPPLGDFPDRVADLFTRYDRLGDGIMDRARQQADELARRQEAIRDGQATPVVDGITSLVDRYTSVNAQAGSNMGAAVDGLVGRLAAVATSAGIDPDRLLSPPPPAMMPVGRAFPAVSGASGPALPMPQSFYRGADPTLSTPDQWWLVLPAPYLTPVRYDPASLKIVQGPPLNQGRVFGGPYDTYNVAQAQWQQAMTGAQFLPPAPAPPPAPTLPPGTPTTSPTTPTTPPTAVYPPTDGIGVTSTSTTPQNGPGTPVMAGLGVDQDGKPIAWGQTTWYLYWQPAGNNPNAPCGVWTFNRATGFVPDASWVTDSSVLWTDPDKAQAEANRRNAVQAAAIANGSPCVRPDVPPVYNPPPSDPPVYNPPPPIGTPPPDPKCCPPATIVVQPCPPTSSPTGPVKCGPVELVSWLYDDCSKGFREKLRPLLGEGTRAALDVTDLEGMRAAMDRWAGPDEVEVTPRAVL